MLLFGLLFGLFLLGLPFAFAILLSGELFLIITDLKPLIVVAQRVFTGMDIFPFLAIPLFIIMGLLMEKAGLSKRLIDWVNMLVGNLPGAMGAVTIIACTIFGTLTGSAPATVAAIGTTMIPTMIREGGYPPKMAAGVIASAGALGNIIPPSIALILYGATMNVSISKLFLGNIIPGLLISLGFLLTNYILVRRLKLKAKEKQKRNLQKALLLTWKAAPALILPFIILGGIYGGIFTPTEAAAIGVLYSLIIGLFLNKYSLKNLHEVFLNSVQTTAMIGFILGAAGIFGWIVATTKIPYMLANAVAPILQSPTMFLAILLVFLLFVGCIMDAGPSIVILAPILAPIGVSLGVNEIHLGVAFCVNLVIGFFTPPFGLNLFTTVSVSKQSYEAVVEGVFPFIYAAVAALLFITFIPEISLWLPKLAYGE